MTMARLLSAFRRPGSPRIVALQTGHADQCAPLHAKSFLHSWSASEFETLLASGSVEGTAAIDSRGEALWGFVLSRRAADEAEILSIAVEPSLRGRGVARSLMLDHLDRLFHIGVGSLFLEVERGNGPACALYARFGFREVGERRGYYRTQGATAAAIVMRKDLP
jgi:ribosomal-protein-alanine N-acetyltransferase